MDTIQGDIVLTKGTTSGSLPGGAETEKVSLHAGQTIRIINYSATRVGKAPEAPLPSSFTDHNRIRHTLTGHVFWTNDPVTTAGGQRIYSSFARLSFALDRKPKLVEGGDTIKPGQLPYMTPGTNDQETITNFITTMVET